MRATQVKVGKVYLHSLEGKLWRVRVKRLYWDKEEGRRAWEGVTVRRQNDLEGGSVCWGWVSELKEEGL